MKLRDRLTLLASGAVAAAVILASIAIYFAVRAQLRGQVDQALRSLADSAVVLQRSPDLGQATVRLPEPVFGGSEGYGQLVGVFGPLDPNALLPRDERANEVAAGEREEYIEDMTIQGSHVRVLTTPVGPELAVQVARPLGEVDRALRNLVWALLAITAGGIALAAALGRVVARAALSPVERLTETTEHVTRTRDLTGRIEVQGRDELSRLATSFNAMLEALESSLGAQRQLVADASHELRTPITSIRTNIEVLARGDLPEDERRQVLQDVVVQLEELTVLVQDVVELARGSEPDTSVEEVRLDLLVEQAVESAQRNTREVTFHLEAEPTVVMGNAARLDRAITNLLDNAAKWSPAGAVVDVQLKGAEVRVRDRGPGISETDLPHIFDRFYRSAAARGRPGSGLGLAIVRQVAESHGGRVTAEHADGGGALFRLKLPQAA